MRKIGLMLGFAIVVSGSMLILTGCTVKSQALADPTTRPLDDPMGYSPIFDNDSVTGNKGGDFDSGDAFNKDVNHVLNP